jgi:hypothetical protein
MCRPKMGSKFNRGRGAMTAKRAKVDQGKDDIRRAIRAKLPAGF